MFVIIIMHYQLVKDVVTMVGIIWGANQSAGGEGVEISKEEVGR